MAKNKSLTPFSLAAEAVTENVRHKLREMAETYAKTILETGLERLVTIHNKTSTDPSRHLKVLPVRDETHGVGYAVQRLNLVSSNKYPPGGKKPAPLIDLRVQRVVDGTTVLKVRYDDKGKATGYEHLARLKDDKLPLFDTFDVQVIEMAIECALEGVNCPNGHGRMLPVSRRRDLGAGPR